MGSANFLKLAADDDTEDLDYSVNIGLRESAGQNLDDECAGLAKAG